MSFAVNRQGALEYLTCRDWDGAVRHGFTTRFGGVSGGVLASLNLGIHRGDRPANVLENYRILGKAVGFSVHDLVFTRQTHSDCVARVGRDDCGQGLFFPVKHPRDALITDEPGVVLTVFTADCTPVLLYDPVRRAVGGVHAGWRGTVQDIAGKTVRAMESAFGCRPEDIRAAIGPCISRCCFETDRDVPQALLDVLGGAAWCCIDGCTPEEVSGGLPECKYHVDLKEANRRQLLRAGVTQISVCGECTACRPDRFWSHRRTGGRRGSLAAVIALK